MFRSLLLIACGFLCSAAPVVEYENPNVRIDLVDGSRVVGQLGQSVLKVETQYGGMAIPLVSVHQFDRLADGRIKIAFRNGDELTVQPKFQQLKCATLFGDVTLQMEHVKVLHVKSQTLQQLPARDRVVTYFGFDSSDDDLVTNQAQDALHATNIGGQWVRGGVNGGAVYFDGSSRLEVPHDKQLCPKTLTFAAWVYPTEESTNYEMLMAKTNASSWHGGYGVCRMAGDAKTVRFFINGYTSVFKASPLPVKKWTHLACVAHGEGIQFYVNGQAVQMGSTKAIKEGTERPPSSVLAARIQHTNQPMTLGGDPSHSGWKGVMDEVVFYDRPLSANQIRNLYELFAETAHKTQPKLPVVPTREHIQQRDRGMEAVE
jgi:hypothetical protein